MSTSTTVPQPLTRNLQIPVTEEAYRRVKVKAAKEDSSMGRVMSDLAEEHLPPVVDAA